MPLHAAAHAHAHATVKALLSLRSGKLRQLRRLSIHRSNLLLQLLVLRGHLPNALHRSACDKPNLLPACQIIAVNMCSHLQKTQPSA